MVDDTTSTARVAGVAGAREAALWARTQMGAYERRLRSLVEIDSGADCPQGREQVAALLCEWAEAAGFATELVPHEAGGHVVAALQGDGDGRVVLLGHHDTVYPVGTAAARPFTIRAGRAVGPGVADMKGGLVMGLLAMEALARGPRAFGAVELHSVPDEEVRTSAFATLDRVLGADVVLVLECGRENGDLVSGRKMGAWLRLVVEGVPAHAGTEPERGRSAVLGLCREVLRCSTVSGAREGLTVVAGTIAGGTIANVVPAQAEAVLDVRSPRRADFDWAIGELKRFGVHDGLALRLENTGEWPGIEQGPAGERLMREAVAIAASLDDAVGGQISGGMSDGCWTAAAGLPTLDGLGPVGGHDHTPDEYMVLDSVPRRCGLLAGLCEAVGGSRLLAGIPA